MSSLGGAVEVIQLVALLSVNLAVNGQTGGCPCMLCLPRLTLCFSDLASDPGGRWTISDTPRDEWSMAIQHITETGVVRVEHGKLGRKRRGEGLEIVSEQDNVDFLQVP